MTVEALSFRDTLLESDVPVIRRILASTEVFREAEIDVAIELARERLHRGEASGYCFVFAVSSDLVHGYACYGPIACTMSSYDLFWIAVQGTHQSRGIGSALIDITEDRIRCMGGTRIYVETSSLASYAATRRFYEKHGYRRQAELQDFYAPGDAKVIYGKVLPLGKVLP